MKPFRDWLSAVAARVVGAFGGRVTIEGRPGGGSRFAVRLPAAPATALPE